MARDKDKDKIKHRHGRSSMPTTPTSTSDGSTSSRVKVKQEDDHIYHHTTGDQTPRHFVPRISTGCAPDSERKTQISHDEGKSTPSAKRKRDAEPVSSDDVAPSPKKPANRSTAFDQASADVAATRRGKMNQVTLNSMTGQEHSLSAGGMSKSPISTAHKQTFTFGTSPLKTKSDKNKTCTNDPIASVLPSQPHTESTDIRSHHTDPLFEFDLGPRALGTACEACGSESHMTRDCPVPSRDGTVVICPFHNCSAHHHRGEPLGHSLDGLRNANPKKESKPIAFCPLIISYREAVKANDSERMRYMLPQLFGELVLNRKRRPFCRVIHPDVCPINIAIEFSREFCQGQMPSGLQGVWPYTMRDARDPVMLDKLQQFDELGWQGMPPGELEGKSWDQVKREYARGVIPPQVHVPKKKRQGDLPALAEKPASEVDQCGQHAKFEQQSTKENGSGKTPEEEADIQFLKDMEFLLDEVLRMSVKVDSMAVRLEAVEARQTRAGPMTEPGDTGGKNPRKENSTVWGDENFWPDGKQKYSRENDLQWLCTKVNSISLRLSAVEARLAGGEPATDTPFSARGTRHQPIDVDHHR